MMLFFVEKGMCFWKISRGALIIYSNQAAFSFFFSSRPLRCFASFSVRFFSAFSCSFFALARTVSSFSVPVYCGHPLPTGLQ